MRIQHNVPALNSYRNYKNNSSVLNKNLEKLSSGYKINRAGDNAAGLAISEKMRAQVTGLKVAQSNAKDGIGMIQAAEGALTEVHSMLNRMVELRMQFGNATYETENKNALSLEFKELEKEIYRILKNTKFNGQGIFTTGVMGDKGFNTDDEGGTMQLKFSGTFGGTNLTKTLAMSTLNQFGLSATTTTAASLATSIQLSMIKNAIDYISGYRAQLGAGQNRLEHAINNLSVLEENVTDAESSLRDTDVAEEMMKYTKNSIMLQSAQAMLAQANQQPQGVLQLLQ